MRSNIGSELESDVGAAAWAAEIKRCLVEIGAGTVELILWNDIRSDLFGGRMDRIMAFASETVKRLEPHLTVNAADRVSLVDQLIATLKSD